MTALEKKVNRGRLVGGGNDLLDGSAEHKAIGKYARTDDMTELKFRAEVMFAPVNGEAYGQRSGKQRLLLAFVPHPHVAANNPFVLVVAQVLDERSFRRIVQERLQRG